MTDQKLSDFRTQPQPDTPTIFCAANKPVWMIVRRFMMGFLKMIDGAYGTESVVRRARYRAEKSGYV